MTVITLEAARALAKSTKKTTKPKKSIRGDRIPQHPLLTRAQWDYLLRDGRINKFSYWTTYGPYHKDEHITYPHAECITIFRKDYRP